MDSKAKTTGYWVVTGLFCAVYLASGTADILHATRVVETLAHLGYPAYLGYILGPWKLLGVLALLAPRAPRVKEWAYAGAFFDLSAGLASHLIIGDPIDKPMLPLVLLGLLVAGYVLRPESRRLAVAAVASQVAVARPAVS